MNFFKFLIKKKRGKPYYCLGITGLLIFIILVSTGWKLGNKETENQIVFAAENAETRASWLNQAAFNSAGRRTKTLSDLKSGHFNTIFLIAPPINNNSGSGTPTNFSAMLQQAKDEGFQVHGWIANYYRTGSANGVDFTSQAERTAQAQWVKDILLAYPSLDGIHLDYIRFPSEFSDMVNKEKTEGVNQTVHDIFVATKQINPAKIVTAAVFSPSQSCVVWAGSYYNSAQDLIWNNEVPEWYRNWFNAQTSDHRWKNVNWGNGKTCAKAVPANLEVQQDPVAWLTGNYVDAVIIMAYDTLLEDWWTGHIDYTQSMLKFNKVENYLDRLYMSFGWYLEENYSTENIASIINKINIGRERGVKGISVFEIGRYLSGGYANDTPLMSALSVNSSINQFNAPFLTEVDPHLTSVSLPPASSCSETLIGDLDNDGKIDITDLKIILSKWGKTNVCDDLNFDGVVNMIDIIFLINHWS